MQQKRCDFFLIFFFMIVICLNEDDDEFLTFPPFLPRNNGVTTCSLFFSFFSSLSLIFFSDTNVSSGTLGLENDDVLTKDENDESAESGSVSLFKMKTGFFCV